jgi:hypothetical protein
MSKNVIAREWLIFFCALALTIAVNQAASWICYGHAWDAFGEFGLFSRRDESRHEAWLALLGPIAGLEMLRFTGWCTFVVFGATHGRTGTRTQRILAAIQAKVSTKSTLVTMVLIAIGALVVVEATKVRNGIAFIRSKLTPSECDKILFFDVRVQGTFDCRFEGRMKNGLSSPVDEIVLDAQFYNSNGELLEAHRCKPYFGEEPLEPDRPVSFFAHAYIGELPSGSKWKLRVIEAHYKR